MYDPKPRSWTKRLKAPKLNPETEHVMQKVAKTFCLLLFFWINHKISKNMHMRDARKKENTKKNPSKILLPQEYFSLFSPCNIVLWPLAARIRYYNKTKRDTEAYQCSQSLPSLPASPSPRGCRHKSCAFCLDCAAKVYMKRKWIYVFLTNHQRSACKAFIKKGKNCD